MNNQTIDGALGFEKIYLVLDKLFFQITIPLILLLALTIFLIHKDRKMKQKTGERA